MFKASGMIWKVIAQSVILALITLVDTVVRNPGQNESPSPVSTTVAGIIPVGLELRSGTIRLTWSDSTSVAVVNYRIIRRESNGKEQGRIIGIVHAGKEVAKSMQYVLVDKKPSSGQYEYTIIRVSGDGASTILGQSLLAII